MYKWYVNCMLPNAPLRIPKRSTYKRSWLHDWGKSCGTDWSSNKGLKGSEEVDEAEDVEEEEEDEDEEELLGDPPCKFNWWWRREKREELEWPWPWLWPSRGILLCCCMLCQLGFPAAIIGVSKWRTNYKETKLTQPTKKMVFVDEY